MSKRSFTLRGMAIGLAMLMFACSEDLENKMGPPDVTQDVAADVETFFDEPIPDQYIVVFNTEKTGDAGARFSGPKQASEHVKKQALSIVRSVAPAFSEEQLLWVYSATINGAAIKLSADKVEALRNDERVAYIEQDRIITLGKPVFGGGDGSTGEETPYGVTRVKGGIEYTGSNKAWVIDTGIDLDHTDLNIDGNNPLHATFITTGKDAETADDLNGHGTHVAGTIAAIKDGKLGVVGVAAGAEVIAVKVLDRRGSGTISGVTKGVDYVAANATSGDVANMSLGGSYSGSLNSAVEKASYQLNPDGTVKKIIHFTLAAGNDNKDASNYSPASAEGPNIYTISAMDDLDEFAYFSNYGKLSEGSPIDYCAPGVDVKSTYKDGTYKTLSGTSMAAPHAAGVLLLGVGHAGSDKVQLLKNSKGYDKDSVLEPIIIYE